MQANKKKANRKELANLVRKIVTEDGDKTRRQVKAGLSRLLQDLVKVLGEDCLACHHPDKAKDKIVQQVIAYLAKPGVSFSIHNACIKVAGRDKTGHCIDVGLYRWCKRHADALRTASEMAAGR